MPWRGYKLEVRNVDVGNGDWVTSAAIFVRKKKSPPGMNTSVQA